MFETCGHLGLFLDVYGPWQTFILPLYLYTVHRLWIAGVTFQNVHAFINALSYPHLHSHQTPHSLCACSSHSPLITQTPHHSYTSTALSTSLLNIWPSHAVYSHFGGVLVSLLLCSERLSHGITACNVQKTDRCWRGSPATDTPSARPAFCRDRECDPLRCGGRVPSGSYTVDGKSSRGIQHCDVTLVDCVCYLCNAIPLDPPCSVKGV